MSPERLPLEAPHLPARGSQRGVGVDVAIVPCAAEAARLEQRHLAVPRSSSNAQ